MPSPLSPKLTATVAPIVPGAPAPWTFMVSEAGSSRSESVQVPSYVPLIAATPAETVIA